MNPKIVRTIIRNLSQNSSGFTLTELLAAIAITGILVAGSSVGLNAILQKNAENEEEILQRQNANRALDFIAEEIKSAQQIDADATNATNFTRNCSDSDVECILVLDVPDIPERIIYFTESASDPWEGPRVIRRWGPDFCSYGGYSKLSSVDQRNGSTNKVNISSGCFDTSDTVVINGSTYTINDIADNTSTPDKENDKILTLSSFSDTDFSVGDAIVGENVTDGWSANMLIDQVASATSSPTCANTLYGSSGGFYSCVEDDRKAQLTLELESSEDNYRIQGTSFARSNN